MHLKLLRIRVAWFTMSWISASLSSLRQLGLQASSPADANVLFLRRSLSPTPPGAPYRLHVVDRWTIKKDLFLRMQGPLFLLIFIQKCLHIIHKLANIKRNYHLVDSAASHVSWLMASLLAPSLSPLFGIVSSEPSWKPSAMRPWSLNVAWRNIISPFPTAFWGCEGCVQSQICFHNMSQKMDIRLSKWTTIHKPLKCRKQFWLSACHIQLNGRD